MGSRLIDETDNQYGMLTVLLLIGTQNGRARWKCKCACGNYSEVYGFNLRSGNARSCGCQIGRRPGPRGSDSVRWVGHGAISGNYWTSIVSRARRKGIDFTITIEYGWNLFLKQSGSCELTGMPLYLHPANANEEQTASLDRIDSNVGYVEGNVQWVHKDVNKMKNVFTSEYFLQLCTMVVNHQELR